MAARESIAELAVGLAAGFCAAAGVDGGHQVEAMVMASTTNSAR